MIPGILNEWQFRGERRQGNWALKPVETWSETYYRPVVLLRSCQGGGAQYFEEERKQS